MTKSELCYKVAVQHIPAQGYRMRFEATPSECKAIAERLGLASLKAFEGQAQIKHGEPMTGKLSFKADVEQLSVVSLKPVQSHIQDSVDILFVEQEPEEPSLQETALIENGYIDLGELFIQYLSLALPDYPRNEGETFESAEDTASNPFAILKKL